MFYNIILTIILLCMITSTKASDAGYYLKTMVGVNNIKPANFSNDDFYGNIKLLDKFPVIESGVGFSFSNGIRLETVFDYYFLFRTNETSYNLNHDTFKISTKTKAQSIMLNAYKDITTIGLFVPFVGLGIGVSKLQESANGYVVSREDAIYRALTTVPERKFYRFTYRLTIGVDIKINDTVTTDVGYNYFNLGNNKKKSTEALYSIGNGTYEIHSLIIGLRIAI